MRGGKRKGAGKPKGYKQPQTLEKLAVLSAFRQRVMTHADNLFNAQYSRAVGSVMIFRVDEEEGENGKKKRTHTLVTDPDEIKQVLDENEGGAGVVGESYYFVTEIPPDNKAIDSMWDRTFGKAQQSVLVEEANPELIRIKQIMQAEADRKGISLKEEMQAYLDTFKGAIPQDIEQSLVSELNN
jgi:hypothetical protein